MVQPWFREKETCRRGQPTWFLGGEPAEDHDSLKPCRRNTERQWCVWSERKRDPWRKKRGRKQGMGRREDMKRRERRRKKESGRGREEGEKKEERREN